MNFLPHDLLNRDEERKLLRQAKRGSIEARDKLINNNMRLIVSIAKKYLIRESYDLEDLIQSGVSGLITAIDRFDLKRTTRLSTYATWWIRQAIQRDITNYDRMIRVPQHQYYNIHLPVSSLEYAPEDDELEQPEPDKRKEKLIHLFRFLDQRYKRIMELRFMHGWTLSQVGEYFDISKERVRQLQNKAIEKLKGLIDA